MSTTEPIRMLLVDDDEPFRSRLARALRARGVDVAEAASVADASRVARECRPRRALIDLRMEDGSGLDAMQR
ncbi:MAG TPA: response regulator, partial [Myxococcota bacterium]|nr:response regulator [Myxococcota bacterium]